MIEFIWLYLFILIRIKMKTQPIALWITDEEPEPYQIQFFRDYMPNHDLVSTNQKKDLYKTVVDNNIDTIITTYKIPISEKIIHYHSNHLSNSSFKRLSVDDKNINKEIIIDQYTSITEIIGNELISLRLIIPYFNNN